LNYEAKGGAKIAKELILRNFEEVLLPLKVNALGLDVRKPYQRDWYGYGLGNLRGIHGVSREYPRHILGIYPTYIRYIYGINTAYGSLVQGPSAPGKREPVL